MAHPTPDSGLMLMMRIVKRHYDRAAEETKSDTPANAKTSNHSWWCCLSNGEPVSQKALRFAWALSTEIKVVHVDCGEDTDGFASRWHELVDTASREAGVHLRVGSIEISIPFVIRPIVDYALELEKANPDRQVAVLLAELVESRWYYALLHNNRPKC